MTRDGLPRAYLRTDPNIDQVYPELRLTFVGLLCAASRQPHRGRFRDRVLLEGLFSRAFVSKSIARGDLRELEDGRWYVVGWDEWQEGDLDVASRMRRMRQRRRDEGITPPKTGRERTADWRLKTQVLERDEFTCRYCGAYEYPRNLLIAEHVVPYPRGKTVLDNLVTACQPCNVRKGTRTPEEAGMVLQAIGYRSETDPLGDTPRVTRSVTRHEAPSSVTVTTDAVPISTSLSTGVGEAPKPPHSGGRRSEGTNPRAVAAKLTAQAEEAERQRKWRRQQRYLAYSRGQLSEAQRIDMDERDAPLEEIGAVPA